MMLQAARQRLFDVLDSRLQSLDDGRESGDDQGHAKQRVEDGEELAVARRRTHIAVADRRARHH